MANCRRSSVSWTTVGHKTALTAAASIAGLYAALKPETLTDAELLQALASLSQLSLGNADAAFCTLLPALQASRTMQASLASGDLKQLLPLAHCLAAGADLLPKLETWLSDLRPGAGPLATVLPFAVLLSLSQLATHSSTASCDNDQLAATGARLGPRSSSIESGSGRNVGDIGAATQDIGSRVMHAREQPFQTLALSVCDHGHALHPMQEAVTALTRRLAAGLAGNLQQPSKACMQSMLSMAGQYARIEHALCATWPLAPAQAAQQVLWDGLINDRSVLAASSASVGWAWPCWDGHALGAEWRPEGMSVQCPDGKSVVLLVMRWDRPGYCRVQTCESLPVRCTLGASALSISLVHEFTKPGVYSLLVRVLPDSEAGRAACVRRQEFDVCVFAVAEGELQDLAASPDGDWQGQRFHKAWDMASGEMAGWPRWTSASELVGALQEQMYVCVQLRPARGKAM